MWVAVIAVVALALVPRWLHRRRDGQVLEAVGGVRRLLLAAHAWQRSRGTPPRMGWVPARACCAEPGSFCRRAPAPTADGFRAPLVPPFRHQVSVVVRGGRLVARARTDLDCDGRSGNFEARFRAPGDGASTVVVTATDPRE